MLGSCGSPIVPFGDAHVCPGSSTIIVVRRCCVCGCCNDDGEEKRRMARGQIIVCVNVCSEYVKSRARAARGKARRGQLEKSEQENGRSADAKLVESSPFASRHQRKKGEFLDVCDPACFISRRAVECCTVASGSSISFVYFATPSRGHSAVWQQEVARTVFRPSTLHEVWFSTFTVTRDGVGSCL